MANEATLLRGLIPTLAGLVVGALSLWAIVGDEGREFEMLRANALCVIEASPASPNAFADFTVEDPIEYLQVGVQRSGMDQQISLVISGTDGIVGNVSLKTTNNHAVFGLGHEVAPGNYALNLQLIEGDSPVQVFIAANVPERKTGWQSMSRILIGLVALSGLLAVLARGFGSARQRMLSAYLFQVLLLVFVLLFTYLLFHEGGHALAQMSFGRFDLSRSDFFGWYRRSHSGGRMGPALRPWQQALISASGPMLPTLIGWVAFVLFFTPMGKRVRSGRPTVTLYWIALILILVLSSFFVIPLFVLGIVTTDGDLNGFINNVPGPRWLVYGMTWGVFVVTAIVVWRILTELCKAWKTWTATFSLQHSPDDNESQG